MMSLQDPWFSDTFRDHLVWSPHLKTSPGEEDQTQRNGETGLGSHNLFVQAENENGISEPQTSAPSHQS